MKKALLIFIILPVQLTCCFAQNYQCVYDGGEYDFIDQANYIQAIRIDSVRTIGADMYYYNFNTVRLNTESGWCYDPYGASWIGRYVIVNLDGYNYFFNINDDTIGINTLAALDESWICYRFANDNYIEATVVAIDALDFIGITDTVKTIQFQAKDSSGNPISHPVNEQQLKLSKEHGLVQLVNFIVFPDLWTSGPNNEYLESFTLCGMTNPKTGRTNITFKEVYDFDIGDEIHTEEYRHGNAVPPFNYDDNVLTILRVINKMTTPGEDTVFYTYHRIMRHYSQTPDTIFLDFYNDTIIETIDFNSPAAVDFSYLPDESVISGIVMDGGLFFMRMIKPSFANGRTEKITPTVNWYSYYEDTCWTEVCWDGCFPDYEYIEGCGGPYYNCVFGFLEESRQLLFFQKGDETWGTPLDPGVVLGMGNPLPGSECQVNIFPNPMHNDAVIKVDGGADFPYRLEFYNILGKRLAEMEIHSPVTPFKVTTLQPGLYIYILKDKHSQIASGKLMVQ
jgi:hypothetical protein